jgi:hypothetical protein
MNGSIFALRIVRNAKELKVPNQDMIERVAAAIGTAHEAAANAFDKYLAETPRLAGQLPYGLCGKAAVYAFEVTPKFWRALKAIGQTNGSYQGMWDISDFGSHPTGDAAQSLEASRVCCEAAASVLRRELSHYGQFSVRAMLD